MNDSSDRLKIGRRAGIAGICANLILFCGKITAGILSGSVSVIADAVNNLSDAGSSIFVLVGYVMSGKPPDKEHPYGHARIEYLCGLFISVIITILGFQLFKESVEKLITGTGAASFSTLTVVIMCLSVAVKAGLAIFYKILAKRINSQVLHASAADSIGDICATSAVIAGIILTPYTGPRTDSVLGCIIAAYILILGIKLIKEASDTLIGTPPDRDFVCGLADKIKSYDGVLGIHDLVVHSYGADRYFVSAHVEVDADEDMMSAHDLIDNIEKDLSENGTQLIIHMDPVKYSDPAVKELRGEVEGVIAEICGKDDAVSTHDFRAVFGVTHTNVIFDMEVSESFELSDRELTDRIKEKMSVLRPECNLVITVDRGYKSSRF